MTQPKCTVYTATTPGYDDLRPKLIEEEGVTLDERVPPPELENGRRWNRENKLMFPPTAGLTSIYLDGSLSPKVKVRDLAEYWLAKADAALFKHPHRTCAYAEIDACVERKKITPEEAEQARGTLLLSGFPRDYGLWALGMVARRVHANALQMTIFPMTWHMTSHIVRDQIWFPFCLWKIKDARKRLHTIDADIFDNQFFSFRRHRA